MHCVEPCEVQVTSINDVKSTHLDRQYIEHVGLVHIAVADLDKGWHRFAQIEQCVQFDSSLGFAKWSPVEQAQTQVDSGRVECVKRSGSRNQTHRQCLINLPVILIERIDQRRAYGNDLDAHVKKLGVNGTQKHFDIVQRFPPHEMRKRYRAKQIGAAEGSNTRIAAATLNDSAKGLPGHKIHNLCEQRFANIHSASQFGLNR